MGTVYEGEHLEIGKRVAIKVIEPSRALSPELAARFRREARAASRVESDHIVQVFDVGEDSKVGLYMVMEYLTGEDLAMRLAREKKLDVATTVTIAIQLAKTLAKAHAAGVVHRDLKPANIFLQRREDGSLHTKILDFGISKLNVEDDDGGEAKERPHAITRRGIALGTPQYMSPQQAQGMPVDHRADVWALGAVLYECLAGVQAYEERASYEQTIIQIVTTKPKPLSEVAPWVNSALAEVVHGALTADLEQRIPDCSTLARRLLEGAPTGAAISGSSLPPLADDSSPHFVVRTNTPDGVAVDDSARTLEAPSTPPIEPKAASAATGTEMEVPTPSGSQPAAPAPKEKRPKAQRVGIRAFWSVVALGAGVLGGMNILEHREAKRQENESRAAASAAGPLASTFSAQPAPPPVAATTDEPPALSAQPSANAMASATASAAQKKPPPLPKPKDNLGTGLQPY
jgi:serine/threonine-protein kinase